MDTTTQEGGKKSRARKVAKRVTKSKENGGCGTCGSSSVGGKSKKNAVKKPKRKLSAYNIFIKSAYSRLKKLHPNDSAPQIMKKAAMEWNSKK
jgi:hypothetical protein